MKNFTTLFLLSSALTLLTITGCKKDEKDPEPTVDHRAQAVGFYDCIIKYYTIESNGTLTYKGASFDEDIELEIRKEDGSSDGMLFLEDGDIGYIGKSVRANTDGFVFDIPLFSEVVQGDDISFDGIDYYINGSDKYDGYYRASDKTIHTVTKYSINSNHMVLMIEGPKL